ncbi:hypothetical protein O7623_18835 [Solwaraspora sp. WMMD791]|uniref:WXG100 family type VII secretion target n=1 Tax=Solwaraspora sp. WMMD791 TaxID=3016086 RepID=UPI00249C8ED0|nr:hypothetical protein [Solwaraspora sp. WMMD791]WFE25442.1 hypothetical protein O7623_18835 [Solwaraspora sp. WMMD791]
MPLADSPLGPDPVYNTSSISCDIATLASSGQQVINDAGRVAGCLERIVGALNGLSGAGAWLGPSATDAQHLFDDFNMAASELFNDDPPGLFAVIGVNLRRAALNYDAAETQTVDIFDTFIDAVGGGTGGGGAGGGTGPSGGTGDDDTPPGGAPNPVVLTEVARS